VGSGIALFQPVASASPVVDNSADSISAAAAPTGQSTSIAAAITPTHAATLAPAAAFASMSGKFWPQPPQGIIGPVDAAEMTAAVDRKIKARDAVFQTGVSSPLTADLSWFASEFKSQDGDNAD
jgi:hypothetical protein